MKTRAYYFTKQLLGAGHQTHNAELEAMWQKTSLLQTWLPAKYQFVLSVINCIQVLNIFQFNIIVFKITI